jgi:hypothetical protein
VSILYFFEGILPPILPVKPKEVTLAKSPKGEAVERGGSEAMGLYRTRINAILYTDCNGIIELLIGGYRYFAVG